MRSDMEIFLRMAALYSTYADNAEFFTLKTKK